MNLLKCVMILSLFVSCSKILPEITESSISSKHPGYTEFIIRKGGHFADGNKPKKITGNSISFNVIFDSSCMYNNIKAENNSDINKLYGFSDCGAPHHENSARFGWRWNGNDFEIFAYCYTNGVRANQLLGTVKPGEDNKLSISLSADKYLFNFKEEIYTMNRHCNATMIDGYQLYPYFGGDETAPHDMRIFIKER